MRSSRSSVSESDDHDRPICRGVRPDHRRVWRQNGNVSRFRPTKGRFLHDCRRTAARNLIRASVPERVAMLLTGHKSRAIFDRYNIIHEQELLDAGDQLVAYLAQQAPARRRPHAVGPAASLRLVRRGTA